MSQNAHILHQLLIDNVEIPLALLDPQWRLVLVNTASRRILEQLGIQDYEGQSLGQLRRNTSAPITIPPLERALYEPFEVNLGEVGKYWVRITQLKSSTGALEYYIISAQDLTAERELYTVRSELLHVISHDVGNIVSLALGYAELMLDSQFTPDEEWLYHRRIYDALHRGKLLVRDVVELEHAKTQGHEIRKVFLLEEAMQQVIRGVMGLVELRYQQLDYQLNNTPIRLLGNMALIKQAIENVLSNAIKYTPDNGLITIRVFTEGNQAVVEIEDSGIGIPQAALEKLGERFYRVENESTRGIQGTGLGLHLVMSVLKRHQGKLEVQSQEGVGSLFRMTLPLYLAINSESAA
jgi:signal transduction histidine kinase